MECNCRVLFRTAEDYRDHLPCESEIEILKRENARLNIRVKELEEIVLSPAENDLLYEYQNSVRCEESYQTPEYEKIVQKLMNFSIAKKPNV